MMESNQKPIVIDYYTDVLCIWAWIAQPRLEELYRQWGDIVEVRHRYVDIFGNARKKIPEQWGESDGYDKFHAHVQKSATDFEHVTIHPDIWANTRPHSSMAAHMVLKAVELVGDNTALRAMERVVREAFFTEGRDIGQLSVLLSLVESVGVTSTAIEEVLEDGSAIAALSQDLRFATDQGIKGSPTWVLNEGRQVLYGNVGYRIISANIEELVNHPGDEASWC